LATGYGDRLTEGDGVGEGAADGIEIGVGNGVDIGLSDSGFGWCCHSHSRRVSPEARTAAASATPT
jgi:hypothetical protein